VVEFHQIAAALYLAAGIGALLGVVVQSQRMERGAVLGLGLGALLHAVGFATLHRIDQPLATGLPMAVSFMAWIGVLSLLLLMWRLRIPALTAVAGPIGFLAAFVGAMYIARSPSVTSSVSGSWPHTHVLLASAGLGLLGVAGIAGVFFLVEHSRLKSKRQLISKNVLPSLEALDRVNVLALAAGFVLLTLGLLTGMLWQQGAHGMFWHGTSHEVWTVIAWAIYAGLAGARFIAHQGARQAAASAVAAFCFLLFAVLGIGVFA
jgi:ABC-type uncharacterized transport system permease subunit